MQLPNLVGVQTPNYNITGCPPHRHDPKTDLRHFRSCIGIQMGLGRIREGLPGFDLLTSPATDVCTMPLFASLVLEYLGAVEFCAGSVGFWGSMPLLPHLCPLSVPEVGYVGYIRKALEKGYLEHPGLHAVLTICLRYSSVLDGACVPCCLLLSTGSYHVFIQIHAMRCCIPICTTEALDSQSGMLWGCKLGASYSPDVP